MTVSAQTPINRSTGNGVTTVFPYTFKIISDADIEVTVDDVVKTLNVDYTVSGAGVDAGGNVTMTTAPAAATTVVRRRNMAIVRTTDYQDQGALPAATLDADIDSAVLMIQQLDERLDRTFSLPASSSADSAMPTPTAGYVIGWDALGESLTNLPASVGTSLIDLSASTGSSLVGFQQSGTGSIQTTVQDELRRTIWVEQFGTNTTPGTTDMTAAINAAIVYANSIGGGKVVTNQAQLITSPILMKSGVQLEINNTLACSGMSAVGASETDHSAVLFMGESVLTSALTVSGAKGDLSVTVASSTGIVIGYMVIVEDSNYWGSTSAGVNSHFARVMNVVGNVLSLNNPLPTAFPSATCLVRKITPVENASVFVKTIAGAPYQGVAFQWARHCVVRDTEINQIGKDAIYFHSAFGNLATNIIARNPTSVVSPFGYGCLFDFGASDNILENSYFEGIREISAGEYARRNAVRGCTIINAIDSALNTHGLGAEDTIFEGNVIRNSAQYAVAIGQLAASGKAADLRTVVRGNTISGSVSYAIREVQYSSGTSIATDTIIEDNVISNTTIAAIFVSGAVATDNVNPIIRNNKIINAGAQAIYLSGLSVKNVHLIGNVIDTTVSDAILLESTGDNIWVQNNIVRNAGSRGIRNYAEGPRILLSANMVENSSVANYLNVGIQAPLAGTWKLGDRMPNEGAVSAGAKSGWICVAAGTPGTWQAISTLA